jgi:hypothetical protein
MPGDTHRMGTTEHEAPHAVSRRTVVLGIPLAEAVVGVVVWRFFNFWLPTIPGFIELVRSAGLGRRLADEYAPPSG